MSEVKRIWWLLKIPIISKFIAWRQLRRTARLSAQLEKDIRRSGKMLQGINTMLIGMGWNRRKRRQFFHDFLKNEEFRQEVFDELLKFYLKDGGLDENRTDPTD